MCEFDDDDIPRNIQTICQTLLERAQSVPRDSLFCDDIFKRTCREIRDRSKAIVVQDITRLIVLSAKTLSIYSARHLDYLLENINEGWTGCIPVQGPRPQPDCCVRLKRSVFTDKQLSRLDLLVGTVCDTYEVECDALALNIADRQNARSITVAVCEWCC